MTAPTPMTLGELERLLSDLDAGAYDDEAPVPRIAEPTPLPKFADTKPFDVRAWAERRGIKLPAG
ncbi:MAG: hypothetical protein U1F50_09540 [Rubrivivax sp.]